MLSDGGDDAADVCEIFPATERPVEIHHVDPLRALRDESLGDRDRIVSVDDLPAGLALAEANDLTVPDVDGGVEVQQGSYWLLDWLGR